MFSTKFIAAAAASFSLMSSVTADYNPASQANVAMYYGQGPDQLRLSHFCDSSSVDIIPIGFINIFPREANGYVAENFGNQCWNGNYTGPGYNGVVNPKNDFLYKQCPQLQEDIYYCQTQTKKKILLSLGGDGGNYKLSGAADGKFLAEFLWGAYGPIDSKLGKLSKVRPLDRGGDNDPSKSVDIDGFDFDIERASTDGQVGYIACINRLRELFAEYKTQNKCSKTYLISGAPQCPLPEANMGEMIAGAQFDLLFIQFYNNGANGCTARNWITKGDKASAFNYNKWVDTIRTGASKNAKLYLGLLGSQAAGVSTDYLTAIEAQSLIDTYHGKAQFGGVMLWEATYAEGNRPSSFPGLNYYQAMKQVLNKYAPATTAPATVCSTTVSSSSSSTVKSSSTSKPVSTTSSSSSKITSSSSLATSTSTVKTSSSSSVAPTSSSVAPTTSSAVTTSSTIESSSSSSVVVTSSTVSTTSSSAAPTSTSIPVCNVAGFAQATALTTFFNNDGSFTFAQCRTQCRTFGTVGTFASGGLLCACYPGSVTETVTPAPLSVFIFSDVGCTGGPPISSSSSIVSSSSSSVESTSSSAVLTSSSSSAVETTSSSSALTSSSSVAPSTSSTAEPTTSSSATSASTETVSSTTSSTTSTSTPVCNVAGFAQATAITTFFNDNGSFTYAQCQAQCLSFGQTFASGKTLCACYPGSLIDTVSPAATSEIVFSDVKCAVGPPSSSTSSAVSTSSIVSISISESSSSESATITIQTSTSLASTTSSAEETFMTPSFSQTFSYDSTTKSSSSSEIATPTPSSSSQSEITTSSSSAELTTSTSGPVTITTPISSSSSFVHFSNTSMTAGTTKSSSTGVTTLPTTSSTTIYTTSTVCTTITSTITACPPSVTDCGVGSVVTKTIPLYTTVCPVTETKTPVGKPTTTAAPTYKPTGPVSKYTTSTVYTTSIYTITSCAPGVACSLGYVTTEVVPHYTTVCPVTESAKPKPSTYSPVVEKPAFTGVAIPSKPIHEYEHSTTTLSSTTTEYKTIKVVKSTATIIPVQYPTVVPYPTGPAGHVKVPVGSGVAKPTAVAQVTSSAKGPEGTKTPVPVYATGSASSSRSAVGVMVAVVAGVVAFML